MPVDPPGDPGGVRSAAGRLDALAAHARQLSATMLASTGVARAGIWAGRDAAAFTATVTATAGALAADADHLAAAGSALRAYAQSLESDQRKVADLAGRIGDLEDDSGDDPANPPDHDDEIRGLRRRMDEWRNDAQVVGNITARELDGLAPAAAPGIGPIASTLTGVTETIEGIDASLQGYADLLLPSWLSPSSASAAGLDLRAWLIQTWNNPADGLQAAQAWAVGGLRSAVNADDFERGDWVAGLLKTLLPDAAYNIGKAEVDWAMRTWQDPAAGFGELGTFLGGLVHADLWRQGRYLEAAGRLVAGDEAVNDWRTGHRARAVGRLIPDLVMTLLTGGESKAATATKAVSGEVIDVSVRAVAKPALKEVVIIDGDDLVIRAESRAENLLAASDPPVGAIDPVPVPDPVPAPVALDDPALRADQYARMRRWFVEQAEAFEFSVTDGGRRISLHTPADRTGQAIEAVWQAFARAEWLAEPGRKVVSIHGSFDFGAFSVGFDPTPYGFRVGPKALAQWLRPALVEGELSEVFLLACKAGALDSGLQSRLIAHVDQAVAALAATVPEDLAPSLRRAVADVLAGQATEAVGSPSLSWVVNKYLWDERSGMWRDRQLADLYELITSPWQVRGSRAAAIARLTPDQLERLLYDSGDAWARQQGRSYKVMNELDELLKGKLEQVPFSHTGADIGDAVRATLTDVLSATMGPAANPTLIDRIATEAEGRIGRWFSLGVDETTIGRLGEAVGPVLAGHVHALGASAADLFEDLTNRLAGEITKAYDATMAQQFADELGVPVLAGRQNVQFVIDGSAWGVDGFHDPWVYGLRRFEPGRPGTAAPRVITPGTGGLPPGADAVAADGDGWLARLRRLVGLEPAPPAPPLAGGVGVPGHPDELARARQAMADADQALFRQQEAGILQGPEDEPARWRAWEAEGERLHQARMLARAEVVKAYQAAGIPVPADGRYLLAVAEREAAGQAYTARAAELGISGYQASMDPRAAAARARLDAASKEVAEAGQALGGVMSNPLDPVLEARLRSAEAAAASAPGKPVVYVYEGFLDPANLATRPPAGLEGLIEAELARAQAHGVQLGTPEHPLRIVTDSLHAAAIGLREGGMNLPTGTLHLSDLWSLRPEAEQRRILAHELHHAVTGPLELPAGLHAEGAAASEALSKTAEGVSDPSAWPPVPEGPWARNVAGGRILAPGDLGPSKWMEGPIYAPGTDGYYRYSYGVAKVFAGAMGAVGQSFPAEFEEVFYRVSRFPPGSIQGTDDLARAFRDEAVRYAGAGSPFAKAMDHALSAAGWPPGGVSPP